MGYRATTIETYRYKDLTVIGALDPCDLIDHCNGYDTVTPLYGIKGGEMILSPVTFTKPWVIGYVDHRRVIMSIDEPTCFFQAKPYDEYKLVYTKEKGYEYITVKEIDKRIETEAKRRIDYALKLYDKGVKGDELYKELDHMCNFRLRNAKANSLRAAIAFARMNDGDYAKDYYMGAMEIMKHTLKYGKSR